MAGYWIRVTRAASMVSPEDITTFVEMNAGLFSSRTRNTVAKVMYGINQKTPDTIFEGFLNWPSRQIHTCIENSIQYVSAQVFFIDGTSTDIRVFP